MALACEGLLKALEESENCTEEDLKMRNFYPNEPSLEEVLSFVCGNEKPQKHILRFSDGTEGSIDFD